VGGGEYNIGWVRKGHTAITDIEVYQYDHETHETNRDEFEYASLMVGGWLCSMIIAYLCT
jgi:hypothetical protein